MEFIGVFIVIATQDASIAEPSLDFRIKGLPNSSLAWELA